MAKHEGTERYREVQRGTERYREGQRGTERYREVQRGTERYREVQRGTGRYREVQGGTERYREVQRGYRVMCVCWVVAGQDQAALDRHQCAERHVRGRGWNPWGARWRHSR